MTCRASPLPSRRPQCRHGGALPFLASLLARAPGSARRTARMLREHRFLFDHVVGAGEERWRHGDPERLCGLQVDDECDFGRLLNGEIGRPLTFEYPSGINARLAIDSVRVG